MNVLLINGSPHDLGEGSRALDIVSDVLVSRGISIRRHEVGEFMGRGCIACRACKNGGGCIFGDITELSREFSDSVGLILSSPVYYAAPNGALVSILDRLFQSSKFDKRMKLGAAIVTARRGGSTSALDVLNKYFSISEMPIVTSSYWNFLYTGGDTEGEGVLKRLGENFADLAYVIHAGRASSDK